ncbi:hypothetical protein LINPERPRIM_LOCUS6467 [Linum perenne]
MDQGRR